MKLELVSHPLCPFVHRAAIMLAEKGIPSERRYVDLKAKPDWFLAISPRGKVPLLVADGTVLFESAAICEFLDETHPPSVVPRDPFRRAIERAWVEVASELFATQYKAFWTPSADEQQAASLAMAQTLARYEDALRSGVLSESTFGLAAIAVAPALHRLVLLGDRLKVPLIGDAPRVAEWARAVAARPSVQSTVPQDFEALWIDSLAERGSHFLKSHGAGPV
jgi:glutathione S-transferase